MILVQKSMDRDTDIGGRNQKFPQTRHSAIIGTRSKDPEMRQRAFEAIVVSYWKPVYKYVRIKWQASNEDAKDLTQDFFATAIEKDYFASYDLTKASFQTFLRTCLDRFATNQKKYDSRAKRGGGVEHLSLDFSAAERELTRYGFNLELTPEDCFHHEWVRSFLMLAVQALHDHYEEDKRGIYFKLFELYDLDEDESEPKATYSSLARKFGLSTAEVTNYLAAARRKFRKIVLEKLRELTASDEEFRAEARALLGESGNELAFRQ